MVPVCVALHVLAMVLWIGHMVFWSLVVGPIAKRFGPSEGVAEGELRERSSRHGGLGWPALAVLIATGAYLMPRRGLAFGQLFSAGVLEDRYALLFAGKLLLVAAMVLYQLLVGHRPAPRLIYLNMLAAFVVVALSVLLVRPAAWL